MPSPVYALSVLAHLHSTLRVCQHQLSSYVSLYLFLTQGLTEFVVNQLASQASQQALGILPRVPYLTTPSTGDTDAFCMCGGALNSGPHVYKVATLLS